MLKTYIIYKPFGFAYEITCVINKKVFIVVLNY